MATADLTRLDLFARGAAYMQQRALKLDPEQVTIQGSDINLICGSTAVMADAVNRQANYKYATLLLDAAENEDLDRLVYDRFGGTTRKGAAPARGTVRFTRPDFSGGVGTIPLGTKLQTSTGIEYITISTASFGPTSVESFARVRATQAGVISQAGKETIKQFSKPSQIFDKTIICTNPDPTAGGDDAEDDETFRNRARLFWQAARRGILAAIEFGALAVPGVTSAMAVEVTTSGGTPARVINLYIADSTGVASTVLANDVQTSLNEYRAGGIQVIISTSLPFLVEIAIQLKYAANVDTTALRDAVQSSLVEYINTLPVNGTLYKAALFTVLQRYKSSGVIADENAIILPAGDLVPSVGQTLRTITSLVTVNGV